MITDFDRSAASAALYVQVTVVFALVVWAGLTFSPVVAAICAGETVVQRVRLLLEPVAVVVLAVVFVEDVGALEHAADTSGSRPRTATDTKVRGIDHRGERTG
jgi:hypothetical protein